MHVGCKGAVGMLEYFVGECNVGECVCVIGMEYPLGEKLEALEGWCV